MILKMRKQIAGFLEKIGMKKGLVKLILFVRGKYKRIQKKIRLIVIPHLVKIRSGSGYYAIDFDTDWNGFGSRLIKTLEILLYCETKGLTPLIRFNYMEKVKPQKDYFKEIFFYKNLPGIDERKLTFTKIRDNDELGWEEDYNQKLRLSFAKSLFDKYLNIQEDIIKEVENFQKQWFKEEKILGVHYRGTDKAGEAPLVSKEKLLAHIREVLKEKQELKIVFLSTDDEGIIRFLENAKLERQLVYREDIFRSTDGEQFHRKKEHSKTLINREAIVNCLLLSKCMFLLKTASILSDCSVIFNPDIEVRIISAPHNSDLTWWPATELNEYALFGLENSTNDVAIGEK
jgi:hypothetical protein